MLIRACTINRSNIYICTYVHTYIYIYVYIYVKTLTSGLLNNRSFRGLILKFCRFLRILIKHLFFYSLTMISLCSLGHD